MTGEKGPGEPTTGTGARGLFEQGLGRVSVSFLLLPCVSSLSLINHAPALWLAGNTLKRNNSHRPKDRDGESPGVADDVGGRGEEFGGEG